MYNLEIIVRKVSGDEKTDIGRVTITNDGDGTLKEGNFSVELSKWMRPSRILKRVKMKGFVYHRPSWDLPYEALRTVIMEGKDVELDTADDNEEENKYKGERKPAGAKGKKTS